VRLSFGLDCLDPEFQLRDGLEDDIGLFSLPLPESIHDGAEVFTLGGPIGVVITLSHTLSDTRRCRGEAIVPESNVLSMLPCGPGVAFFGVKAMPVGVKCWNSFSEDMSKFHQSRIVGYQWH
jgi:hypothetical protein